MLEELKTKTFANDEEEAVWWKSHEDDLLHEFRKAESEGRLGISTAVRRAALKTTTIRLDPDDVAKARIQAEARGLRYQTYLKMLIHEAVVAEEQRRKKTA